MNETFEEMRQRVSHEFAPTENPVDGGAVAEPGVGFLIILLWTLALCSWALHLLGFYTRGAP